MQSQSVRLRTNAALKEFYKLTEKPQQNNWKENDEEQKEGEEEEAEEAKNTQEWRLERKMK